MNYSAFDTAKQVSLLRAEHKPAYHRGQESHASFLSPTGGAKGQISKYQRKSTQQCRGNGSFNLASTFNVHVEARS